MNDSAVVNAKLTHARYLVRAMLADAVTLEQRQLNSALVEAATMQLAVAYRAFVRELAMGLKLTQIDHCSDALSLWSILLKQGLSSPEVHELQQLEAAAPMASDSWLANLLFADNHFRNPHFAESASSHAAKAHAAVVAKNEALAKNSILTQKSMSADQASVDTAVPITLIEAVQISEEPVVALAPPLPGVEQVTHDLLMLTALIQRLRETLVEY